MFRKDKSCRSGGILVYVSSFLRPKRVIFFENIVPDSIWIEIKDKTQTYLLCTLYRPPH
jgi:hypothetical protein